MKRYKKTENKMEANKKKDVFEVLKQAVGDESVIFEEGTIEEPSGDEEVEEIIEIIEEVEEDDDDDDEEDDEDDESITKRESFNRNQTNTKSYGKTNSLRKIENKKSIHKSKELDQHIVTYDADEDWEDEDMDRNEDSNPFPPDYHKPSQSHSSGTNNMRNSQTDSEEIVRNTENNLVYTVLGNKKQYEAKSSKTAGHFVKVERLEENTIPIQGTLYYQGDDMETLYLAQSTEAEDDQQYQFGSEPPESEHSWDQQGDKNKQQHEENSEDQIFLHEDEDGQLYFKDKEGNLKPVYLTEDGNYAIADTNDQNQESQSSSQHTPERNFIMPDLELRSTGNNKQEERTSSSLNDAENEDNTVTISLIISEDENGQKRTQVIIPTTDSLKCDICNKGFKTSLQLLRHNRLKHAREEDITTRNFPCDLCPKRYPDQNSLARHRKTHTGDRPFQCLECHKRFPTATSLRRHLTLHNAQNRPLPCIYCGRRFVDKASLAKHEQSHTAGEQKHHSCDMCPKSFTNMTDLNIHRKYHDPDRKFDCEICGREFNRLNNLQRHMLVHQQQQGETEEILSCDVCGITYKFMSSLTRHMVTTHMNPEKLRKQAEEQRKKRENNYRRYVENRKMYEPQNVVKSVSSSNIPIKRNHRLIAEMCEDDGA